ncbi:hypothetical protein SLEP1_g55462 [Rubroshorea leprosula]|uniref:Uncharacterized protein n=1 Tax=Rubroshorea leprosula TaxID=152421 RepID=A0AAV5MFK4_9ROSI|nr:hypothetical protein SLEP1_g55462 [Rubroshorea leprosula]
MENPRFVERINVKELLERISIRLNLGQPQYQTNLSDDGNYASSVQLIQEEDYIAMKLIYNGYPFATIEEAEQSAAKHAILELEKSHDFAIEDVNYTKMQAFEEALQRQSCLREVEKEKEAEYKDHVSSIVEGLRKMLQRMKISYYSKKKMNVLLNNI